MASRAKRRSSRLTSTQARAARRTRRQARRRVLRFGAFAAVGMVALLFIAALFAPGLPISIGGGGTPDGPGERLPDQGNRHVDPGQEHVAYNSLPAVSGPHYPQPLAPAPWGEHTEPLPDEVLVHNLEHAGVGLLYDCPEGCPELVQQLREMMSLADKVILAPYPGMETKIALTAWTFIDRLEEFDEERIRAFMGAHINSANAPEPTGL